MLTSNFMVITLISDLICQCHFTSYCISIYPDYYCLPCLHKGNVSTLPLHLFPNKSICCNVKFQALFNFLLSCMAVFCLIFLSMNSGCCRLSTFSKNNPLPAQKLHLSPTCALSPHFAILNFYPFARRCIFLEIY